MLRLIGMTHRRSLLATIGLVLAVALTSCRGAGSGQTASLDGSWILDGGTDDSATIPLVPGRDVTLVIEGGTVSGRACNQYSGSITVAGSQVSLGSLSMTEMACDEPMMATEAAYHAALAKIDAARRSGDRLTLTGPGVTLRYTLQPPVAQAPLVGTYWVLQTVITGEVAASTIGEPASLQLDAGGTATGSTGCRSFTATYSRDGDRLTLADFSVEKVMCTRDLAEQDQLVVGVLSGGASVQIDGLSLTLRAGDGSGLQYAAVHSSPAVRDPDPIDLLLPPGKELPLATLTPEP